LIIARLEGEKINHKGYRDNIISLVQKDIGGFILFGGKRDEIKEFIDELQSISKIHLFIASDIERGVGQQIKGLTDFPCPMAIAAAINRYKEKDISLLKNAITAIAKEAKDVGINMPLIPVLDVNQNPDNPIICTRAYSDSAEAVAWFGSFFIEIFERECLISCAKHFPGHGDTTVDSHIALPVIPKPFGEIYDNDLMPFVMAIKKAVSAIMIGHLSLPAIDSKPSTISTKLITDLLRKRLGFQGLILTDALNMNALKDIENLPARSLNAGATILLHPIDVEQTVRDIENALRSRLIDKSTINSALFYIMKAKEKFKNIKKVRFNIQKHASLSKQIIQKSITIVKRTAKILPLKELDKCSLYFAGDRSISETSLLRTYFKNFLHIMDMDNVEYPTEFSIFAIFTNVSAWSGTSGIHDIEIQKIKRLMKNSKKSIIISFGSPYILRHFNDADILIAAYEAGENQQNAVLKLLNKGMRYFKGYLPVKLYAS